jgi:hypothetical protein
VGYTHTMQVLHSDQRRRVTLPPPARPKDSWISETVRPDQILLTRVRRPLKSATKPQIIRQNGYSVGVLPRPIDPKAITRALEEFP